MKYLILVLCFGLTMPIFAQDLVIYNYKTGKVKNIKPRRYGDFITLRIDNINTFKYKVTIQGEDIEYTTPIPSELQTIFRIQDRYTTEKKGSLLEAVGNTTAEVDKMSAHAGVVNAVTNPAAATTVNALKSDMTNLASVCNSIKQPTKDIAEIQYTRMELISLSKQKWEDYSALSAQLTSIPSPNRDKMKRDYMDYIDKYRKVEAAYEKAINSANEYIEQDSINNYQNSVAAGVADQSARDAAHTIADKQRKKLLNPIQKASKNIKEAYETLEYDGDEYLQLIEDVLTLYTALNNKKNFEVLSAPIQLDTDFAGFKIEVVPMKSNALLPIEHSKTADFRIGTRGGWKADFSVGATLAFGPGMKDSLYSLEPDTSTGMSFLRAGKNNNVARPGLAAMMHFYPRTGKPVAFGGMFGVGADFKAIDDPDISLFLGASLVLGIREKIMISGGVSFQRVNRNKSNYMVDVEYDSNEISLDKINQKAFVASPFIAVSYNLTTRRNLTFK